MAKLYFEFSYHNMTDSKMMPSFVKLLKISILKSKLMNGEELTKQDTRYLNMTDYVFDSYMGWILRFSAEVYALINHSYIPEAEDSIKRAIEADKKYGMKFYLAKDYALYADLFKRKKDIPKTKENMTKAIDIFTECGAHGWVEKYEKKLAVLSS